MATAKERSRISETLDLKIIPECCKGNKNAEDYLRRIFFVLRITDDYYDEDVKIKKESVVKAVFILLGELPSNAFYKKHIDSLTAIHIVGFNAWQDANEWEKDDNELKRLYAHVIRDTICELMAMVAFLIDGQTHMKKISMKVRELFLKELGN